MTSALESSIGYANSQIEDRLEVNNRFTNITNHINKSSDDSSTDKGFSSRERTLLYFLVATSIFLLCSPVIRRVVKAIRQKASKSDVEAPMRNARWDARLKDPSSFKGDIDRFTKGPKQGQRRYSSTSEDAAEAEIEERGQPDLRRGMSWCWADRELLNLQRGRI